MMAVPTERELRRIAGDTGFPARTLEVVTRLLDVLQAITDDPVLDGRVVLKGGTALNGFHADWPRLSVDIDLSYLGTPSLDDALAARPEIDGALRRILADRGYEAPDEPTRPGGGKWTAPFASHFGGMRELRIDLAYVDRQLLFDPVRMSSFPLGGNAATDVLVVDRREAFAGKLRAMFTRHYGRDVFDAAEFLSAGTPDWPSIRPAFLAYAAAGHANPRRFSVDRVASRQGKMAPFLHDQMSDHRSGGMSVEERIARSIETCRLGLRDVMDWSEGERAFLDGVWDRGELNAHLLTGPAEVLARIAAMPQLIHRCGEVRREKSAQAFSVMPRRPGRALSL